MMEFLNVSPGRRGGALKFLVINELGCTYEEVGMG